MAKGQYLADYNRINKTYSVSDVKKKIFEIHGDSLSLMENTYINARTKALFVHKIYGEWWIEPTLLIKRKTKHPNKIAINKLSIEDIKKRLKKRFGDEIILDESTYINTHQKARFIDRTYGEFYRTAKSVLKYGAMHPKKSVEKRQETMLKRHGAKNPQQVLKIALRTAKSANNSCVKYHWKTNEELICQGGYEPIVIDYLNQHKIDFEWQPKTFLMPDTKTYRPDLYLINENKWIEIKGWMRKDAQEKWDWFQSIMPNSELWDRKKLRNRGINVK